MVVAINHPDIEFVPQKDCFRDHCNQTTGNSRLVICDGNRFRVPVCPDHDVDTYDVFHEDKIRAAVVYAKG